MIVGVWHECVYASVCESECVWHECVWCVEECMNVCIHTQLHFTFQAQRTVLKNTTSYKYGAQHEKVC